MSKIKLYIASSLDGYIAREGGQLDWLDALPHPEGVDYGYADFYASIDTVILGSKTYEEVSGFGVDWPYPDCKTYVISNRSLDTPTPKTEVITEITQKSIAKIKRDCQQNCWLIGGGSIISQFLDLKAVDEMILSVAPVILGKGIPLFPEHPQETKLKLVKAESFESGMVNLHYERDRPETSGV